MKRNIKEISISSYSFAKQLIVLYRLEILYFQNFTKILFYHGTGALGIERCYMLYTLQLATNLLWPSTDISLGTPID